MLDLANNSCALLIGVDDYSDYDAGKTLEGSVNDVAAWVRVCRAIHIDPRNIRVLVTRTLDDEGKLRADLPVGRFPPGTTVLEATHDNILDGVKWLADQLSTSNAPGLLTYSGHGDTMPDGELALCPKDVTPSKDGAGVDKLIGLSEIGDIVGGKLARRLLTVVLDCCQGGVSRREGSTSLALRPKGPPAQSYLVRPGARILYACQPGQTAVQSEFTSQFHGAFTWALTAALLQWKPVTQRGAVQLDLSYGKARDVAQQLLGVLGYENQTATLDTTEGEGQPFFHPSLGEDANQTSDAPTGERDRIQLDPNIRYSLYLGTSNTATLLAQVMVVGTTDIYITGHTDAPLTADNQENWFVSSSAVESLFTSGASNLFIEFVSLTGNTSTNPLPLAAGLTWPATFTVAATVASWSALAAPSASATSKVHVFKGNVTGPAGAEGYVLLNVTSSSRNNVTTYKLEHVYFYLPDASAPTTGLKTFNPSSPTGEYYSSHTLPGSGIKGALSR
jgi:hypothetical protein